MRFISTRTHGVLDCLSGLLILGSPWIFDFDEQVYPPHVIFGMLEIGAGLFTERVPYRHGEHHRGDIRGAH
ncbi:hypothetical protein DYU11_23810 [Fibrisoma montanum]|uniref:Uncharacterized protein n=1 Tax=Fibrisoma montanum TaxID=2305895 RepID=A0A418M2S6_9BACT|nr:hypothetical protein [Fibrisoma montanum]RIV19945.1 hypothetical protein DYU11_23810 [Fibrisoma montanum]